MMHFRYAKHLQAYVREECTGNCAHCKWLYPKDECKLIEKLFIDDYRWIPCKERLPECNGTENTKLLVTIQRGKSREVRRVNFYTSPSGEQVWFILGSAEKIDPSLIKAWTKEPAAYTGGDDEEDSNNSDIGGDTAD